MTNKKEMVEKLKIKCESDAAVKAVLQVFSERQRARSKVTLRALWLRMHNKGHKLSKNQLASVLKFFGEVGIGEPSFDGKGRLTALKNIKITLQSLGMAALGHKTTIDSYTERQKYSSVETPSFVERRVNPRVKFAHLVSLSFELNGKPVTVEIPKEASPEEIAALVGKFQERRAA